MASNKIEIEDFNLNNRNLYIYNDIDNFTASDFLKECNDIIINDNNIIKNNKQNIKKILGTDVEIKIPDVNIHLNTCGGTCYDGWAIHDTIKRLSKHCNVHITVEGCCMSMGIVLLLAVPLNNRHCTKNSTFMIHQTSCFIAGKSATLENEVKEVKRLTEMIYSLITSETAITKKELDANYNKKDDWIINADKALELKLVNEII